MVVFVSNFSLASISFIYLFFLCELSHLGLPHIQPHFRSVYEHFSLREKLKMLPNQAAKMVLEYSVPSDPAWSPHQLGPAGRSRPSSPLRGPLSAIFEPGTHASLPHFFIPGRAVPDPDMASGNKTIQNHSLFVVLADMNLHIFLLGLKDDAVTSSKMAPPASLPLVELPLKEAKPAAVTSQGAGANGRGCRHGNARVARAFSAGWKR